MPFSGRWRTNLATQIDQTKELLCNIYKSLLAVWKIAPFPFHVDLPFPCSTWTVAVTVRAWRPKRVAGKRRTLVRLLFSVPPLMLLKALIGRHLKMPAEEEEEEPAQRSTRNQASNVMQEYVPHRRCHNCTVRKIQKRRLGYVSW